MSNAPLKDEEYPRYFRESGKLLAFVAKDRMYKVEPIGSNKNPGVTIDYCITRNMVLKHYPTRGTQVDAGSFKETLTKLFESYIDRIVH